jgi:hypothetical protein
MKAENKKLKNELNRLQEDKKVEVDLLREHQDQVVKSLQQQVNDLKVCAGPPSLASHFALGLSLGLLGWVDRVMIPLPCA